MSNEPLAFPNLSLWSRFVPFKTILVSFTLVGLLASNVASLVSVSAHDWMHNALWQVLSIGDQAVADRALANSPKAKLEDTVKKRTAELDAKNRLQAKELEDVQVKNLKLAQQVAVNGKQAKATVEAVHQRLKKGVARNLTALPAESIPYLGLAVTIGVTSLDIYDACQTMKDFNALLNMMGQGAVNPELCGQKVPSLDQVLIDAKTKWRESYIRVRDEAKQLKVPVPEIRTPTLGDVSNVTCPVVKLPRLCIKG